MVSRKNRKSRGQSESILAAKANEKENQQYENKNPTNTD